MTTKKSPSADARPTLDEVAEYAGVGRGTVSRVINGSSQVSPKAREAVERAVAELGYVPNLAARSLVTRRTNAVALVVSESQERVFGEPFFAGIVRGISSGLIDTQIQLWLAMAQSRAERQRVESHLTTQHVDGVMLLSLHDDDPLPALVERRGLPLVLGGRPARLTRPGASVEWFVDVDNIGGARRAVEHLYRSGRQVIATITGPQDMGGGLERLSGYQQACEEHDLSCDADLIAYGDFSYDSGMAAMRQLLERRPDIDGVFAAADLMAAGALRVLREHGRRVPEDVAVVGFDDSSLARQTDPSLTTVRQPIDEMGRAMARLLVTRISDEEPAQPHAVLDTDLVIRESA
ncbi:LacI family transcriptional regulator [Actinobacteria bacterium YIM 96077]|uniref:LacI family transcriptional regulator n=1 Tax=Phytoactinopolyspora halophila TaxID=1981511 RepID=A0A329QAP2_9ACTN|nr:LacI family DNA-binding transcriptional regulator [Phytoactinopolyspora halophila]AYY12906.1 LacI family transcriptional regulator [Actinobacteria bacterium YIM 96077]RAW09297.1 LacI family transcriptional regulator [Phytoactinopolyspora halophila]